MLAKLGYFYTPQLSDLNFWLNFQRSQWSHIQTCEVSQDFQVTQAFKTLPHGPKHLIALLIYYYVAKKLSWLLYTILLWQILFCVQK